MTDFFDPRCTGKTAFATKGGLPAPVLPAPLSWMVAPYTALTRRGRTFGAAILIPVTNAIEALNSKLRRAVRIRDLFPG